MGFTLGLPPGFYAPDKPEIRELVNKIKHLNGIILPSAVADQSNFTKKSIIVSNLPLDISTEDITQTITNNLLHRKLITDRNPVETCRIHKSRWVAFLEMKTPKDAAAAVQLGSVISGHHALKITYLNTKMDDVNPGTAADYFDRANTLDSLFVDATLPLPSTESIKAAFEQKFPVEDIVKPNGFNHALVNLVDNSNVDLAIFLLKGLIVDGVKLRVRRAFANESEGPMLLDEKEQRRARIAAGPSTLLTVLSPLMRKKACVADILNPEVPVSVVVQPETERRQKPTGNTLLIFNIAPTFVTLDNDACQDMISDVREECSKYGRVIECVVFPLPSNEALPCDYAVVKVVFEDAKEAKEAQIQLSGRRYAGRLVITQLVK